MFAMSVHGKQPKGMFMNNADKVIIASDRFCPPHRFPHAWPWQPKITEEPCHVHVNHKFRGSLFANILASFRRCHHNGYCQVLRCPHYCWMRERCEEVLAREEGWNPEEPLSA
ncbi:MAG: hypothetical protein Q7S29_04300 [Candidatus Peribacter sp.]|nr:hypothetical protein [Candidatus Peribacter sp.]